MRKEILVGQRFGRLLVVSEAHIGRSRPHWNCVCDCGRTTIASSANLKRGHVSSCGCLSRELTAFRSTTHGETHTRLYHIWQSMIRRCTDPNKDGFESYGGRGIDVCQEWRTSFESFKKWAIENGYRDDLSIDRINVDGNYSPENCRWLNPKDQARNRRSNISFQGKCVAEWAEILNVKAPTIYKRLENNWDIEKALFTQIRPRRAS